MLVGFISIIIACKDTCSGYFKQNNIILIYKTFFQIKSKFLRFELYIDQSISIHRPI